MLRTIFAAVAALSLAVLLSCTNKGHAPGGGSLDMPAITTAVNGGAASSVGVLAVNGASLNSSSCSICGSNTDFSFVHYLVSLFIIQGKLSDANSCMTKAVAEADLIPGLTSGEYKYLQNGNITMRVKVKTSGTTVTDFEMVHCMDGAQVQYLATTNVGGAATFKMRSTSTSNFVAFDATGTLNGESWTSKSLDVSFYSTSGPSLQKFNITQEASYFDVTGVMDSGTIGTTDGTDVRLVSRVQLLGATPTEYALGDGSIRRAIGAGATSNNNWNGDTGVHGAGPTTYDAVVASATLPTPSAVYPTAFAAGETWDCVMPGEVFNLASAMSNADFVKKAMACEEVFE